MLYLKLQNALALTRGMNPSNLSQKHALAMRHYALAKLLGKAEAPPPKRKKCGMFGCQMPGQENQISCCVCGRWCHLKCVALLEKPNTEFVCPVCKAQYE